MVVETWVVVYRVTVVGTSIVFVVGSVAVEYSVLVVMITSTYGTVVVVVS